MLDKLKKIIVDEVCFYEKVLRGKSGAEKKAAVVAKLDALIKLPGWLEWADDALISWLIDEACEKLNLLRDDISKATADERARVADELEDKKS